MKITELLSYASNPYVPCPKYLMLALDCSGHYVVQVIVLKTIC